MKEPSELQKKIEAIAPVEKSLEFEIGRSLASDYGYGYATGEEGRKHLADYWRVVRKYLWMIVGITLLVTTLVTIYQARQPSVYEARARVQVDLEDNPGYGLGKNNAIVLGGSSDPVYFNTQLQTLNSLDLLRRVVRTLDLENDRTFLRPLEKQSLWEGLLRVVGMGGPTEAEKRAFATQEIPISKSIAPPTSRHDLIEISKLEGYVGALLGGLRVDPVQETRSPVRETRLIDIRFQHLDPVLAAKVANTVADVFVRSNLEKKSGRSVDASDFLQKRIAELQTEIRTREEQLISYARSNHILSLEPNQNTVVERLAVLNRQLLEAENERKAAESAYQASLNPGAAEALAEREVSQVGAIQQKLGELKMRRAQLLVENTEKWPEVREIDTQIAELERQIAETRTQSVKTLTTNLETQYRQTLAREQLLRDAFEVQRRETTSQNEAAINYRLIQKEIETYNGLLDGLLQRSKENSVMLAGIANNVSVVDYATIPKGPIGPKRMQTIQLAFVLALLFGLGLAFLLNYLDTGLHSSEEVERALGLPALAVVPTITGGGRRQSFAARSGFPLLTADNGASENGNGFHPELLFNMEGSSPTTESFRQLRTTVLLSTPGRAPKTLLIASGGPGDGKTVTTINTAVILAQTGARVLVIDADMRHPSVHKFFGIENEHGLSSILSSNATEAEMLSTLQSHEATGIQVLTSGPPPANPAELLGSDQMARLLASLSNNFTHIVIDSPPITFFTDSVLISSLVDGVLLVVNAKRTSREVVRRSRKLLRDTGAKIFGVVLNQAPSSTINYRYYDYY